VESRALTRSHSDLSCGDVMSRDIVSIDSTASVQTAHSLLLDHGVHTLPVTDLSAVSSARSGCGKSLDILAASPTL
jgi:CBS domain-containing membrane protein